MARTERVPPVWLVSEEDRTQPTQSRSVGLSISDAVGAHRFPTDWRLTVRRVGRQKRVSLMRSRNGALGSLWVMDDVQDPAHTLPQHLSKRTLRRCNAVAPSCRFCCKSLFVQVIANSSSRGCGFRVNMWGTSSPVINSQATSPPLSTPP